jgi:AraC-like DNA-binding protein
MIDPEVPENAIRAFECLNQLRVTIHDLSGSLWPFLSHDRLEHVQPICQMIKIGGGANRCVAWGVTRQRRETAQYPQGRVQVCHAGLVEWVLPIYAKEKLQWVLFAGVRSAANGLEAAYDEYNPVAGNLWRESSERPVPVTDEEAALLLENLRQLAARLQLWWLENENDAQQFTLSGRSSVRLDSLAERKTLILRFIVMRHKDNMRLSDLAAYLGLSECRTSHAVRESCGATFQELIIQARLRTSMGLLRHSGMGMCEIALSSGFENPRQFYRLFRREIGTTPLQYRKTSRS